jgi:hypothetical protein
LRLHLVEAKRVYPSKRLEADFQAACARWKKANVSAFMPRSQKAELKEDLKKAALADAPVGVDGIQVVFHIGEGCIYTDAVSDAWLDRLASVLVGCDVKIIPVSADSICDSHGIAMATAQPLQIGDRVRVEMFADALSREFLTWLWMKSEKGGSVEVSAGKSVDVLIDGPLVLQTSGGGAVVKKVTLDGERATRGRETARALMSNKLLTKAKVTLALGSDRVFEMTLCADGLLLKGVKLPDCESMNYKDQIGERFEYIEELLELMELLVERFSQLRGPEMEEQLRSWVAAKGQEGGA